jgi:Flp pilus assembly pilin Flp
MKRILEFLKDESGQELIERTVLVAFVVLFIVILISGTNGINSMWESANTQLSSAVVSSS